MATIEVISLGCDKNRVDTEHLLPQIKTNEDTVLINTCAFLKSARKESINTILQNINAGKRVIVAGCLVQKYRAEVEKLIPEVSQWLSINEYDKMGQRQQTTPAHYAYLKVSDGCNNCCAYCTIPSIRGNYREYPLKQLVDEAKALNVKEIILVAQDLTKYSRLIELIRELSELKNIQWIRLLYCYPQGVTDELINEILTNPKVCKYIDVPMQHSEDEILKSMNRKNTKAINTALLEKLKGKVAIRSTFIVGLPGETEQNFENLLNFLKQHKLNNVGFFEYSREMDTPAGKMPNQIDGKIKRIRRIRAEKVQSVVQDELLKQMFGNVIKIVCEEKIDMLHYKCRSEFQAPDIDPYIIVKSEKQLIVGEFYEIKINGVNKNILTGEKINGKI